MQQDIFQRFTLTPDQLMGTEGPQAFNALGVIHVRDALPKHALTNLKKELLAIFDTYEADVGERMTRVTFSNGGPPAKGRAYEALAEAAREIIFPCFPYGPAIAALAGCSEIRGMNLYAREARVVGPSSAALRHHQDYTSFVRFTGCEEVYKMKRLLTCWIPLVEIDEQTPTIEYVPAKLDTELPYVTNGTLDYDQVGSALDRLPVWVPPASLGDMCVHDQFTIHRSHVTPERTKTRYSLEIRFFVA